MPDLVTRQEIVELLNSWQAGKLNAQSVYDWANERYSTEHWNVEDEIVNEVLSELDILDINLITTDDIPVFLKVLALPPAQIDSAIAILKAHSLTFSIEARKQQCRKDPFYAWLLNE
ncbi:hypothetical protein [Geothrix sp. PMB-07]|uniref:hypothetical protein n=1 Tax=Geothrix sp. PMB-07 TaxID=3068640 RepID=UPI002741AF11|nr:hypothetical protein [Geothrix sp. PMB-07]WLT30419.1 hypothetical protein Q9293_11885 [Geothrix sp. PMB-07]